MDQEKQQFIRRNHGQLDGAEVCEFVGLFILNGLSKEYGKESIGLYRDDGLAIFKNISGPQTERIRKNIIRHLKNHGLKITIQTNLKAVNYLDVSFEVVKVFILWSAFS